MAPTCEWCEMSYEKSTSNTLPRRKVLCFQSTSANVIAAIGGHGAYARKKLCSKSTYPPPADGVCVLFLCKPRCNANEPTAQAGRATLRARRNFTDCKVSKRNAERLHSDSASDYERGRAVGPGFIAQERGKCRNTGIFRNAVDLFPTLAITFDSIEKLP